jgi:N-terminal domain of anti-restriction factor ArdC
MNALEEQRGLDRTFPPPPIAKSHEAGALNEKNWFGCSCFWTPIGPTGLQQEHHHVAYEHPQHQRSHHRQQWHSQHPCRAAQEKCGAPNRSDSPYQGRTAQRDNPTQAIIKQAVDYLIQQVEAGKSETLTAYLTAMARFHNYSFGNIVAIARQMPTATRVAGFWTWKNLGRSVNAGQKGIRILAPIVGVRRKKGEEAEKDITKQNERVLLGFRNAYVFDVSQTNGVDLPTMHEVNGDPGKNIDRLAAFLKGKGIQLVYNEKIAPALGMSYGGRIAILPGQSKAEEFSTLVHETAHEMLHKAERRTATTKTVRETEAEAVAFVVGKAVGLVTSTASADYIQLYHGNASLLAESLQVIQQTASVILAALELPIAEEAATDEFAEVAA